MKAGAVNSKVKFNVRSLTTEVFVVDLMPKMSVIDELESVESMMSINLL